MIGLCSLQFILLSVVLGSSIVTHFISTRRSTGTRFLLKVLRGLFSYLEHFLYKEFEYFIFLSNLKLLYFLDSIKLYMIWLRFHSCKLLLHLLELKYLLPLLDHNVLLSLDHIIFTCNFIFESFILSIKSLLDNLDGWSSWSLPNMLVAHCSCLLNIGCFFGENCLLFIGQAGRYIWLI